MLAQLQSQKQQYRFLPQQIELLNIFFLNSLELQQKMKNELEENPFLDIHEDSETEEADARSSKDDVQDFESSEEYMYDDNPDHRSEHQNYFDTAIAPSLAIANVVTFKEDAKQQLRLLKISDKDTAKAEYIIDMLNPQGFLDRTLNEVADDMSFFFQSIVDATTITRLLTIVHSLDPIGIGTRSIREYLLLQLYSSNTKSLQVTRAIFLLEHHYTDLMQRKFEKLNHTIKVNDAEMRQVLTLIGTLKFHPVRDAYQHDPKQTIIPDFIITNYGGTVQVNLFSSKAGSVFVNQSLYDQLANHISSKDKMASQYVKSKLNSAKWFVNAIKQREDTMMRIMQCIVTIQKEYFMYGDIKYLKPMVLKNISEVLGLDISAISRITGNKYADTPFGLIFLKKLFSEGIADKSGEIISSKVIKSLLVDAIELENKKQPYTDQDMVNILSLKGYNIARRTVSKYRQQMQMPTAQIRAVWA
ncbi:MAG: rpoN [Flavipsychrobacter sp.]|jgi:RNA polymerase sigma-54 factor|nr:rpoN [Flavipsychrobacter sp.]